MLASVGLWGIRFVVAGHTFTIPAKPASDWIEVIVSGTVADLLEDAETERLADLAVAEDISAELDRVFTDVISEVTGRDWYVGVRLISLLFQDDLRGEVLSRVDPSARPLAAVLDVTYTTIVRWKTAEQRTEFDTMLFAPADFAPGESDPRERARQMREKSRRLMEQQSETGVSSEAREASDTPSNGIPPTST